MQHVLAVLRSEIPSSKCAKLHTVAASNKITRGDHSLITCSCHIYIGVHLHAHPVRGESHIQRNANGEVAVVAFNTKGHLAIAF